MTREADLVFGVRCFWYRGFAIILVRLGLAGLACHILFLNDPDMYIICIYCENSFRIPILGEVRTGKHDRISRGSTRKVILPRQYRTKFPKEPYPGSPS